MIWASFIVQYQKFTFVSAQPHKKNLCMLLNCRYSVLHPDFLELESLIPSSCFMISYKTRHCFYLVCLFGNSSFSFLLNSCETSECEYSFLIAHFFFQIKTVLRFDLCLRVSRCLPIKTSLVRSCLDVQCELNIYLSFSTIMNLRLDFLTINISP